MSPEAIIATRQLNLAEANQEQLGCIPASRGPKSLVGLRLTSRGYVKTASILGLASLLCSACKESSPPAITHDEISRKTQELFDAIAPGNKEPWEKYIADDAMYFDEKANNMDKKALMATIEPLPAGVSGTIKIVNSKINRQGNTLIHSYDMDETENFHGQQLRARYHATDTWMNRDQRWQIVAGQVLRYYEDPAAGVADPKKFPDYVGTYELAAERQVVSSENGKLYLTRGARPRVELIPEACDIFFRKGIEGRLIFQYADAKVNSLIQRRNNEDIVWKKAR